jgi:hypothetical protein
MIRYDYAADHRDSRGVFDGVCQPAEGVRVIPEMSQHTVITELA